LKRRALEPSGEEARRARLSALARLGAGVQKERGDGAIHRSVGEGLAALGLRNLLLVPAGDGLRAEAALAPAPGADPAELAVAAACPWTPFLRTAWREGVSFAADPGPELARLLGRSDESGTVGLRVDAMGLPSALLVAAGAWLRPEDQPALRLFGSQISAALDASRAIQALSAGNAELAALRQLAAAAGSVQDLGAFLREGSDVVRQALGARSLGVYLLDADALRLVFVGGPPGRLDARCQRVPLDAHVLGPLLRAGGPLSASAEAFGEPGRSLLAELGLRTVGAAPLRYQRVPIGLLVVAWAEARDEAACHLELLQAMGAHFAAAVHSHQQVARLKTRVADVEAVNALMTRVFGLEPVDAPRILAAVCRDTVAALRARSAVVMELDERRETLQGVAGHGDPLPPAGISIPVSRAALVTRALRERAPVWTPDLSAEPESAVRGRAGHPRLSMLVVPLAARGTVRGVVAVAGEPGRRWAPEEVALAQAMAASATVALDNARLHVESQRRVEELGLLLEVGRSLVATLDLDRVLDTGVRNLARIVGATDAYLFLAEEGARRMVARAVTGTRPGVLGTAISLEPGRQSLVALVADRREAIVLEDAASDPRASAGMREATGARAALGLPLVVRGRVIGAAVIVDPVAPRRFSAAEVERAAAIANQLAVAAENARLYDDLRRSYADLARAQAQLVRRERLAALGELAAVVAHEVRNPLGAIFNSLAALRRLVRPEEGDARMLFDIVGEEADRLNRIVGDLLDFARPTQTAIQPEPIAPLLDDALGVALAQAAAGVRTRREVEDGLPPVPADALQLRQAFVNVLLNAVQAMPSGGTLTVAARREGDAVRVEIADTGPGVAPELRRKVFEPFFTTRATGTGLGLAVVRRVVEDHRGEVAVEAAAGGGARFVFRLPFGAAVRTG